MKKLDLIRAMKSSYQIEDKQSILEHGKSVMRHFNRIIAFIEHDIELQPDLEIPQWLLDYKSRIKPLLYSKSIMNKYLVFHDCGKPYCQIKNEYG